MITLLLACSTPDVPAATAPVAPQAPTVATAPAEDETTSDARPSLYELPIALVDQDGVERALDLYRGHPVIVSMVYTSCSSACPLTIQRVQQIEDALPPEVLADTRVLLVSLDPAHDDPKAMRAMLDDHGVDVARWTLARTDEDHVRDVAAVLGVKYRVTSGGMVDHSTTITVLDRAGRVAAQQTGLTDPVAPLASAIAGSAS